MNGFWLVSPYAAWILILSLCPATAGWYALRAFLTLALLAVALYKGGGVSKLIPVSGWRGWLAALAVGLAIFAVWIAPEELFGYGGAPISAADSPYSPQNCGWSLTIIKLLGSALVISVAEELFFRRWLVEFAGFWPMVVLFAVEHGDRWAVGAVTGVVYGLLAKRFGLGSSTVAHALTNLVLGLWVIGRDAWRYW